MRTITKRTAFVLLSAALAGLALAKTLRAQDKSKLQTVPSVDLKRYTGTWYEIARYPNRFQRKCDADTKATYSLRTDAKIDVVNSCRKADGSVTLARGTAKIVDKSTNAKLKVTFFWPFAGDYWVIGLDPEYRYAIVGEPKRKYLWILSRTPQMPANLFRTAIQQLDAAGYDPARLIMTKQTYASNGTDMGHAFGSK